MHDIVQKVIENPPYWILAVVVAVLAAHTLRSVLKFLLSLIHISIQSPRALVAILELMVVVVLSLLLFHLLGDSAIHPNHPKEYGDWYHDPFSMVCLLVFFVLVSLLIYILHEKMLPAGNLAPRRSQKKK